MRKRLGTIWFIVLIVQVTSILFIAFYVSGILENDHRYTLVLGYTLIAVYSIILLLIILGFIVTGLQTNWLESLKQTSLAILLTGSSVGLSYSLIEYQKQRENTLTIIVENNTSSTVKYFNIFGRRAKSTIDSLLPNSQREILFKGKNILRNLDNDMENEISISYRHKGLWKRKPIYHDAGRWLGIETGLKIEFTLKIRSEYVSLKKT
jgi:hypothetical protein